MFTRAAGSPPLLVSSSWYDEPGPVGIPAVSVVIVWTLCIVVSARLIENTLWENFQLQYFLISYEN